GELSGLALWLFGRAVSARRRRADQALFEHTRDEQADFERTRRAAAFGDEDRKAEPENQDKQRNDGEAAREHVFSLLAPPFPMTGLNLP
ncbi:MAG: hypothetical protein ABJK32_16325, partial [Nitratireductor sp.]